MDKEITINGNKITYTIKKLRQSKKLRLRILSKNCVKITVPYWTSNKVAEKFLHENLAWIAGNIKQMAEKPRPEPQFPVYNTLNKILATTVIRNRVAYFAKKYNLTYATVTVKNQKSVWGSCSKRKNLNFSYKVAFLPNSLREYIIIHELCHLKEFNHSKAFWLKVAEIYPNYKIAEEKLKRYSLTLD